MGKNISGMLHDRSGGAKKIDTYTKTQIDAKDREMYDAALAAALEEDHTHANKDILDATEEPYTTSEKEKLASLSNYEHPTHTEHSKGLYKFANDGLGHVSGAEAVTKEDIVALGIPGENTDENVKQNELSTSDENEYELLLSGNTGTDDYTGQSNKTSLISYKNGAVKAKSDKTDTPEFEAIYGSDGVNCRIRKKTSVRFFRKDALSWSIGDSDEKAYIGILGDYDDEIVQYIALYYGNYGPMCYFSNDGVFIAPKFNGANATQSEQGLMSAEDKTKLDNISDNANNYVHPTTSGNKHIPPGGSSGQILRWYADGTAVWGEDNDTVAESISNIELENMLN